MNGLAISSVLFLVLVEKSNARATLNNYNERKTNLIEEETLQSLGGSLRLTEKELLVNEKLMQWKEIEVNNSFYNPQYFNYSKHYFDFKDEMKKSKVYQFIQRMPKGAVLHVHSSLMLGANYLIELTYEDHLYACLTDDNLELRFSHTEPQRPCSVKWTLMSDLRNASEDIAQFDAKLKNYFTLDSDDHIGFHTDINAVWKKFNQVYFTIKSLISYRPVREKAFYQALQNFYNDNVMYIEIRSGLSSLYELNGTVHDKIYMATLYDEVTKLFMKVNPDFVGIKLIMTRARATNVDKVREALDLSRQVKQELPAMFAGFDLVGQEDVGRPLAEFSPVLLEAQDEINYYFHGGETNWYGTPVDENLFDAVLLGTKRIGHAYALIKHPALMTAVAEKDIALEVNVISNSVLSLVQDLRNHPLAIFLARGMPVVLSSDDPGVWGAEPLSDDFYVAFVAIASKHADLRMLKQLAINSIKYSALDDNGKTRLFSIFENKWNAFIDDVIATRL
ncbi:hypothetical protein MSG28_005709 [Choristoneura fumiferana]|uniref:Uncharacterized protein n=1 Tax=Choristoneura fumiferana TaxID=7141 RepID=A0ACC0L0J9_CHOFU|nr:hypothetical protein MSG28_005709 [Choristoneura fumiferana]